MSAAPSPLARDWHEVVDVRTGRIFFAHAKSNAVSWRRPRDPPPYDPERSPPSAPYSPSFPYLADVELLLRDELDPDQEADRPGWPGR